MSGAQQSSKKNPTPALTFAAKERLAILLAAYAKHGEALGAIEASQQQLTLLILGAYSVGLTFVGAYIRDGHKLAQGAAIALIGAGLPLAIYGVFVSRLRARARRDVRKGVLRIDQALGFFQKDVYLEGETLYPEEWERFPEKRGVLDYLPVVIPLAFLAFVILVIGAAVWDPWGAAAKPTP